VDEFVRIMGIKQDDKLTLPLLYSTQAAFFLLSVVNAPAIVAVMVLGGMCRSPGPSVRGLFCFGGFGRACEGITSPGRTIVAVVAIVSRLGVQVLELSHGEDIMVGVWMPRR
jgi:hypothetical protein